MIRIICSNCNAKLRAKREWAGKHTKCPKCGEPVHIPPGPGESSPAGSAGDTAPQEIDVSDSEVLPVLEVPERLSRQNHYLILSKDKLFATWQDNGQGWKLRTSHGFTSAGRSHDQLPGQGEFVLAELVLELTDEGLRLTGLTAYELAYRYALTRLERGSDDILHAVVGLGRLNREQKNEIRKYIRQQFMQVVWADATDVREYLGNTDYHSPGTVFEAAHE